MAVEDGIAHVAAVAEVVSVEYSGPRWNVVVACGRAPSATGSHCSTKYDTKYDCKRIARWHNTMRFVYVASTGTVQ